MYIIQTIEFARLQCVKAKHLELHGQALSLQDGEDTGGLVTQPFDPRLAYKYEGFELWPDEQGVTIALIKPGFGYFAYQHSAWSLVTAPVFYTPEQLRLAFAHWSGPIQFQLKLERSLQGRSPQLEVLKFAYHAPGNIIDYCLEFALPQILSVPIEFSYPVEAAGQRLSVPLPPSFVPARMQHIQVYVPGHLPQPGTLATVGETTTIVVTRPLEAGTPRLLFDYAPSVSYLPDEILFQIADVPTIVIRLLAGSNYRQHQATDSIRLAGGQTRIWEAKFNYDQPFELRIIANNSLEAGRIGERLLSVVKAAGKVSALPYGVDVPLQTLGSLSRGSAEKLNAGNLQLLSLKMVLLQQVQGESYHDEDTITGSDVTIAASSTP